MSKNRSTNWQDNQSFDPSDLYNQIKADYAAKYDNLSEGDIEDYLDRIAFHESKGEWDAVQQINDKVDEHGNVLSTKDGLGKGLFQFESGKGNGAEVAIQRFRNYYKDNDPELAKISIPNDFSTIPPDMQKLLFMTNMISVENRGEGRSEWTGDVDGMPAAGMIGPGGLPIGSVAPHVKANLSDVKAKGDQGLEDFWINYHWAGYKVDPDSIADRRKSWRRDNEIYNQRALD